MDDQRRVTAAVHNGTQKVLRATVYRHKLSVAASQELDILPGQTHLVGYSETDTCSPFRLVLHAGRTRVHTMAVSQPIELRVEPVPGNDQQDGGGAYGVVTETNSTGLDLDLVRRTRQQEMLAHKIAGGEHSYYEILQVPRDADTETITKAWRRLALRFHTDRHPNATAAEREYFNNMFQAVFQAYTILSSPEERKAYDATLRVGLANRTYTGQFHEVWRSGRLAWLIGCIIALGFGLAVIVSTAGAALPVVLSGGALGGVFLGGGIGAASYLLSDEAALAAAMGKFSPMEMGKHAAIYAVGGLVVGLAGGAAGAAMATAKIASPVAHFAATEGVQGTLWGLHGVISDGVTSGEFKLKWERGERGAIVLNIVKAIVVSAAAGAAGGAVFGRISHTVAAFSGDLGSVNGRALRQTLEAALKELKMMKRYGIKGAMSAAQGLAKILSETALNAGVGLAAGTPAEDAPGADDADAAPRLDDDDLVNMAADEDHAGFLCVRGHAKAVMIVKYTRATGEKVERKARSGNPSVHLHGDTVFPVTVAFRCGSGSPVSAYDRTAKCWVSPTQPHVYRLRGPVRSRRFLVLKSTLGSAYVAQIRDCEEQELPFCAADELSSTH